MSELTVGGVKLVVAGHSDTGRKRKVNEDSFLVEAPVFVVADGMGGYEAGDRASAAVVEAFRENAVVEGFATLLGIRNALVAAEAKVAVVAGETTRGAGSTVAGAILIEHEGAPSWLVFNVGDSRVYRHIGTELDQLTIDHSLGQELVDAGEMRQEDLATFPHRNVITRAIGASDGSADSWLVPVINGERLLICSDGLTSELADESIRATLTMGGRPEAVAATLVQRANEAGGRDNISVIVIDVVSGGADAGSDSMTGSGIRSTVGTDTDKNDTTVEL